MNKPTFTLGNSLIIFASLAMFISVMSLNIDYSNIQSFTTADLTEYTQLPAEINKPVTWINDNTQQTVETEPPEVVETDTSEVGGKLQKTVTVSSDIHYENILTYSSVPDLLPEQVKLFWMIDGIKTDVTAREDFNVTFYDENSDNLIDKISWIIPHLSEQEFILEFDITVINPWEYGASGGDWIVYFNTTGTGTLNITKDELSTQVLTFNYIKCGESTIYSSVGEYSYIIENYSCSEIAEISHTIGQMPSEVFGMQFDFGNDFNNDVDFAYDPAPDMDGDMLEMVADSLGQPLEESNYGGDDEKADTDGDGCIDSDEWFLNTQRIQRLDLVNPSDCSCEIIKTVVGDDDNDCLSNQFELHVQSLGGATALDPVNSNTDGDFTADYQEIYYSFLYFTHGGTGLPCLTGDASDGTLCVAKANSGGTSSVSFAYDKDGDGLFEADEDVSSMDDNPPGGTINPNDPGGTGAWPNPPPNWLGCRFLALNGLDADLDCLSDFWEQTLCTDPLLADTDSDSCSDYEEFLAGTDACDCNVGACAGYTGCGSNNAPTAADVTGTNNEDTDQIILNSTFSSFSDADGDGMTKIKITTLETVGDLKLSGSHVTLNQEVTDTQLAAGNLIFTPLANQSGTNYDEIKFKVSDGIDYSTSAYNLSFTVTAVNDDPHFTVGPSDGGSNGSSPTNDDGTLTFSGTAYDVEGDTWTLLVCGSSTAPSSGNCASGVNQIGKASSPVASASQSTFGLDVSTFDSSNWTSEGMHENDTDWWAFACDSNNACSAAAQGSGLTGTPFSINNKPSVNDVKIISSAGSNHLAYTGSSLTAGAGYGTIADPDGDSEGTSTYKWWKQTDATGSYVDITSSFTSNLPGSTQFNKDDRIVFEYLPVDAHGYGGSEVNVSICGTATSCTYMDILNSNPIAVTDEYNVDSGNSFTTTSGSGGNGVLYNGTDDSDPDPEDTILGGQLIVTANTQASGDTGTINVQENGSFSYTSSGSYTSTTDSFTYTLSDQDGGTDTGTVNIDITKSAEVGVSGSLGPSSLILFNATESNGSTYLADGNNGLGTTSYSITFQGNGSTVDLQIKADQALTNTVPNPDETIAIGNYKYINNSNSAANTSLSAWQTGVNLMTTSFVDLVTDAAAATNHTMYIKFFLTVPAGTNAGNYSNTITFRSNTA